jgi:hypothetical protein
MRCALRAVIGTAATLALASSGVFACADTAAICTRAGGTFAEGTCTRSGPEEAAVKRFCQERGAIYLAGSNTCAYGEGR